MEWAHRAGDIFWASMMVIVMLVVGFFILRLVANTVGKGNIVGQAATKFGNLATPGGQG